MINFDAVDSSECRSYIESEKGYTYNIATETIDYL